MEDLSDAYKLGQSYTAWESAMIKAAPPEVQARVRWKNRPNPFVWRWQDGRCSAEMPDGNESLPIHLEHPFQVWSYSHSHRTLVLRGRPGEDYDHYVDVEFGNVLGMKLATGYARLSVEVAADASEMDEFLRSPKRYEDRFMKLVVSDGERTGFVVCGRVRVLRGIGWQNPRP